jgi:hypothetical protein
MSVFTASPWTNWPSSELVINDIGWDSYLETSTDEAVWKAAHAVLNRQVYPTDSDDITHSVYSKPYQRFVGKLHASASGASKPPARQPVFIVMFLEDTHVPYTYPKSSGLPRSFVPVGMRLVKRWYCHLCNR